MKLYDLLAGRLSLGPTKRLSRHEVLEQIPGLAPGGIRGAVRFYDAQFDDGRLAVTLARSASDYGAVLLNYVEVTSLMKSGGRVSGVIAEDVLASDTFEVRGRVIINASGVFSDSVRRLDDKDASPLLALSQGAHLVLDGDFLLGDNALLVPKTDDGRVLFAIPWLGKVVVGTTDISVSTPSLEPIPREDEIEFILAHLRRYLSRSPSRSDIRSVFAGLRPLVQSKRTRRTASLGRDHKVLVSVSGLISVLGGKWTTYRKMAEETVDVATQVGRLACSKSQTRSLRLHGWTDQKDSGVSRMYGSDSPAIANLIEDDPTLAELLHPGFEYSLAHVVWSVRKEWAQTVEDVLSRRTRLLLLDADASIRSARKVARVMAREFGYEPSWEEDQVAAYLELARKYLPQRR
jgi:glycerol-3-phosphate dehydrogenase